MRRRARVDIVAQAGTQREGRVVERGALRPGGENFMRPKWLAVVIATVALAACGQSTSGSAPANSPTKGPPIPIAMVTHGQAFDPFWSLVKKGAEQAASDFNVTLKYQAPKTTNPQEQASMITQAAGAKPRALIATIPTPAVLSNPIHQAVLSGIPVVIVNVGAAVYRQLGAIAFVGQQELVAGAEAGSKMAGAGVRHALCVITEAKNTALTDRCAGFSRQMKARGATVQILHVNGSSLHDSQSAIEKALKQNSSINGVLTTTIIGFNAAGGALHSMSAFGKIKLGTFDPSSAGLTAVQNGQALFIIDQQPFLEGYSAVQVAAFQVRYGQHPFAPIYTGPSLITRSNAAQIAQLYKNTGIALFKGGYPQ
jgi:simple sugar transport system substrate-binding protein